MSDVNLLPVNNKKFIKIVESLAQKIWSEYYIPFIGEIPVKYMLEKFQSEKAISAQIKGGSFYYLIEYKNIFIGYFSFNLENHHMFLSKIYINADYKGQGFGKRTFQFLENIAQENNLSEIILRVNKNNTNSIKAYEKIGFVITDSVIQDIGNGFFMDDYKMTKNNINTKIKLKS